MQGVATYVGVIPGGLANDRVTFILGDELGEVKTVNVSPDKAIDFVKEVLEVACEVKYGADVTVMIGVAK